MASLSPYRQGKAREVFNTFNVFNALSWTLLAGNIITLFAMRLQASSTYIGILNAMLYVALFCLPAGKFFARRFSIVGIFSFAWIIRAIGMVPVIIAPLAAHQGNRELALGLTMLGVAIFHVIRGVGMIGNNPVLNHLSSGPDRGSYMTQIQIINSATGMFSGFAVAIALGRDPPLFVYSIIMAAGMICGITSGVLIKKIPEPPYERTDEKNSLVGIFKEAFYQPQLKLFLIIFFITALVSGVSRIFLVVYAREVFFQDDGMVLLYSVFGGLGNLLVGMLIKFIVDRIGAKPIFILCVIAGLITMIPIILFTPSAATSTTTIILFLSSLFFMLNFGFLGSEGIAQTYFMGLVPPAKMLDMGMLYFFVFGIAGAGGSFVAGLFLDIFSGIGFSPLASFKVLYAVLIALSLVVIFMMRKLTSLGALPFIGAVKVMFSYRDLQAISLLDRLNKTHDSREEEMLLGALHKAPSQLAIKGLLERARSPRLVTRMEAIRAFEHMEELSEAAEAALLNDIINNPFTTAYISARILGNHGCSSAIPVLRELVVSTDYMLAGEAIIALAKLRDNAFRPRIEEIILNTKNPRLKIMGAEALGIYGSPDSLYTLIGMLLGEDPPPYVHDEVVVAMSAIIGAQNRFYRILARYAAEPSLAPTLALDEAEAAAEYCNANLGGRKSGAKSGTKKHAPPVLVEQAQNIQSAVLSLVKDNDGEPFSRWIQNLPSGLFSQAPSFETARAIFSEALLDKDLSSQDRLRLLIAHWASSLIRIWVKRFK